MNTSESSRRTFHSRLNQLIEQLRKDITSGMYEKGSYLPPEKTLAKQFKLSNKSVRKGLDELVAEKWIEKVPRVGSLVIYSGPTVSVKSKVKLIMGCYPNDERSIKLSLLLKDYVLEHPHVQVETVSLQSESNIIDTLCPALDHGLVDLFTLKDRHFQELVEAGFLSKLKKQSYKEHIYPFLNNAFTKENELYAQPLIFSPLILAYNRQHFREAGMMEPEVGWTWHDAIHYASQLSMPDQRYGIHFQILLEERWPVFLLQSANISSDDEGMSEIGDKWLEGLRLCKNMIRNQRIFPSHLYNSSRDVGTLFLQGLTSMIMTSYDSLNRFATSDLDYDISSLPYINEPNTLLFTTGIAVNHLSEHNEFAQSLANYLASPRAQQLIRKNTLSIPSSKLAAESPDDMEDDLNRPAKFHLYRELIPGFRRFNDLHLTASSLHSLREVLKKYWTDLISEQQLCEEINHIVAKTKRITNPG